MNIPEENSAKETPDKRWLKIRSTQEILDNRYAKIQALESELAELREQLKQERDKAIDACIATLKRESELYNAKIIINALYEVSLMLEALKS